MDIKVQPPDFIAALEQMSKLKDYLLHLHESEVSHLRDEGARLKNDVFTLRALVNKDSDDKTMEHIIRVTSQDSVSDTGGGDGARKALSEPVLRQTPPDVLGAPTSSQGLRRGRRPSENSGRRPFSRRPSEGSQVFGSPRSLSPTTSSKGLYEDSMRDARRAAGYRSSKDSRRRSNSPVWQDVRNTAREVMSSDSGSIHRISSGRRDCQMNNMPSQGSGLDFSTIIPTDHSVEVSPQGSRRKRGASRAHTLQGLPPDGPGARRNSFGTASNDSAELLATGSLCLSRSIGSRGSSKELEGERFHLRDVWRESSNVLLTSTKNWRSVPSPQTIEHKQHHFGLKLSRGLGLRLLHPASRLRLLWELLTTLLVIYDIAVVPMQPFEWPPESFTNATDWVSRAFWTVDVAASFLTGVYINLELELRFWEVARTYAKGWMAFDVVIVISEWVPVFVMSGGGESSGAGRMLDHFRLLRFARTLRFFKLEMVFERFGSVFNSAVAWRAHNVVRMFLYFVVGIHMTACGWFWVGSRSGDGWVAREIEEEAGVDYEYLTSVRWALAQLHGASEVVPTNTSESAYAIAALLLGLGSLCLLISAANSGMIRLQEMRSSVAKQRLLMRSYLRKNNVSRELSLAVKNCFDVQMKLRVKESNADQALEAVAFLPQNLRMDIEEEVRSPFMFANSFFSDIDDCNPRIVRQLCHECCSEKSVRPVEVVFAAGDACTSMYFVVAGEFQYSRLCSKSSGEACLFPDSPMNSNASDAGRVDDDVKEEYELSRGCWVSEAVLWVTAWEHCGEFRAAAGGGLLVLEAAKFITMLSLHHASACAYASRYGRKFVQQLNEMAESCWSDVVDSIHIDKEDILAEEERATRIDDLADEAATERRLNKCRTMSTVTHQHYIFISHHKAGGGTEATLMQEALERIIDSDLDNPGHHMIAPVFLDSEDLSDLSDLKGHVRNTMNLVLLLTEEVLKRPWVLVEIVTAYQKGVHIVPVEIYKRDDKTPFKYPDDAFYKKLSNGELLTESENDLLRDEGISVDDLEKALRHVFKKIALPFSPHKSGNVREAELTDILRRCTDTIQPSDLGYEGGELPGVPDSTAGIALPRGSAAPTDAHQLSRQAAPQALCQPSQTSSFGAVAGAQPKSPSHQGATAGKPTLSPVGENPASPATGDAAIPVRDDPAIMLS